MNAPLPFRNERDETSTSSVAVATNPPVATAPKRAPAKNVPVAPEGATPNALRLKDLSDREVLLAVLNSERESDDGWVTAYDVAVRLGMVPASSEPDDVDEESVHGRRCVSSRLSWMRRYDTVERELLWDEHGNPVMRGGVQRVGQRWRLSWLGRSVALGTLNDGQRKVIESANGAAELLLMARHVARAAQDTNGAGSKLVQREWQHRFGR